MIKLILSLYKTNDISVEAAEALIRETLLEKTLEAKEENAEERSTFDFINCDNNPMYKDTSKSISNEEFIDMLNKLLP
jgi:hypothetical protein